jgi:hypothetical protein
MKINRNRGASARDRRASISSAGSNSPTARARSQSQRVGQGQRSRALTAPERSTPVQQQQRLDGLHSQIEAAKNLPPQKASVFLRAAYALRQAILTLGDKNRSTQKNESIDRNISETKDRGAVERVNKTERDLAAAGEQLGSDLDSVEAADTAAKNSESGLDSVSAGEKRSIIDLLKAKAPEQLSAQELAEGILEVQSNIDQGRLLLPADASKLMRVLYAIKMTLFQLAEADPRMTFENKDDLVQKIKSKLSRRESIPDKTIHDLKKALGALIETDK